MPNDRIEKEWFQFCRACMRNLTHEEYVDMKRTFYAGASSFYSIVMGSGNNTPEQDVELMRELREEIRVFNEKVKAGQA